MDPNDKRPTGEEQQENSDDGLQGGSSDSDRDFEGDAPGDDQERSGE
jgi:hypothetical protein